MVSGDLAVSRLGFPQRCAAVRPQRGDWRVRRSCLGTSVFDNAESRGRGRLRCFSAALCGTSPITVFEKRR